MPIVNNPYVIGNSPTDTQNFRLQSGNDGTLTLSRKSDGSGGNILTVASDGKVTLTQGLQPVTRYVSSAQTITASGLLTLAHGLGAKPYRIIATIINTTAEGGYSIGDELIYTTSVYMDAANASRGATVYFDATNVYVRFGGSPISIANKSTGVLFTGVPANWQLYIRAEL